MKSFKQILDENELEQIDLFSQGKGNIVDRMIQKEEIDAFQIRIPKKDNERLKEVSKVFGVTKNQGIVNILSSSLDEIESDPRYQQMKKGMEEK